MIYHCETNSIYDVIWTRNIQIFCGLSSSFRGSDPIFHKIAVTLYMNTGHHL
jgi:hypothetical protein